jgi:hypothetical protein
MCDSAGLIDAGRCSLEASQLCVAIRRDARVRTAGRCQAADLSRRSNSAAIACSQAVMNSGDRSRRHLPNIGRNEVGIPLTCPQICDRTEPVVAEAHVRPSPRDCGNRGAGPDIDLAATVGRAPRATERKAMITFLLLLTIPTLLILNRLEKGRSRRTVSVDGFKMINGQIVFRRKS